MLLFSFFLVSSCQSERIDLPNATTEAVKTTDAKTPYFNQQVEKNYDAAAEKAIKERIQNFSDLLKRAENQSLPENSTMNESDVVWNVEALLNSRYGWADRPFSSQIVQKDVVIIPRNADGSVDVAALPAAIEQARLKVAARYDAVSGNKHIIAIDIEPKTIESGNLGLEIGTVIGEEAAAAPMPLDDWFYGSGAGRCDGSGGGSDASIELTERTNVRATVPSGHVYFADIEWKDLGNYINSNDVTIQDNIRDRLMFHQVLFGYPNNPAWTDCVYASEMIWFRDNIWNTVIPNDRPAGKTFILIQIWGAPFSSSVVPPLSGIHHTGRAKYGVSIYCSSVPCTPNSPASCLFCNG
jgi:hypothetical protein